MKMLEVQNYVTRSLRIADCEWDWTEDRSNASFISKDGVFRVVRLPDGFLYQPLTVVHLLGTDCIIAVHRTGHAAWQLCSQTGAIREAAALSGREGLDQGLMYHRFGVARDRLLLIYEGGLCAFGASGKKVWHHDHAKLDWKTEVGESGTIIVKSPLGDAWQYDCTDGTRTELPPAPPDLPPATPGG